MAIRASGLIPWINQGLWHVLDILEEEPFAESKHLWEARFSHIYRNFASMPALQRCHRCASLSYWPLHEACVIAKLPWLIQHLESMLRPLSSQILNPHMLQLPPRAQCTFVCASRSVLPQNPSASAYTCKIYLSGLIWLAHICDSTRLHAVVHAIDGMQR